VAESELRLLGEYDGKNPTAERDARFVGLKGTRNKKKKRQEK